MPKVITVGEILVEIMTKNIGQEFSSPGEMIGPYPSGAPAIFIDQVARMGVGCGIIAKVGTDDFGRLNIARLNRDGVDVSRIVQAPEYTTGTAFVTYFEDGSRKFIFHFGNSAAGCLSSEDIDEDYIKSAEYLHIMGCSLSASGSMRNAILKAVRVAVDNNVKISFDPNIRPELLRDPHIKDTFDEVLRVSDILLTGENEVLFLMNSSGIESAIQELKNRGISVIILRNGSKGMNIYHKDQRIFIPSFDVEEVDPTGAGDCFDGAFIACLADHMEVREAAVHASAAGALSVTKKGPMEGAAFKEEIIRFIASNNA